MDQKIKDHLNEVFAEVEKCLGFKPKLYIAGGSIASIVLGETPKDYDMWFETPEAFNEVNNSKFVNIFNSGKTKYATTLTLPSGKIVQFVQNRMGPPDVLVPSFDFKHAQSYYTQDGKLSYDLNFIQSRTLTFQGKFDHPMNTMERVLKFSKRGYYVPFETLQSLMLEIKKLDEETIKGLQKHTGSL